MVRWYEAHPGLVERTTPHHRIERVRVADGEGVDLLVALLKLDRPMDWDSDGDNDVSDEGDEGDET